MNLKVYKIETYGMKNIKDKITIEFYPKTISKSKKNLSNIKAIYGTNGAGKSAFMSSVQLYKNLLVTNLFLKQTKEVKILNKMINQNRNEFYFSIVYGSTKVNKSVYKHEIKISFENENPYISFEKISKLNSQTTNGDFEILVEVNDGELFLNTTKKTFFDELLIEKTKNILRYTSISSIILEKDIIQKVIEYTENNHEKNNISDLNSIHNILLNRLLGESIVVYLDNMDIHQEYDESYFEEFLYKYFNDKDVRQKIMMGSKKDIVQKDDFESYENHIKKLYNFLRIFKTDLLRIDIDKQEDKDLFYCSKKMIYEEYKVDSDCESTGIQKMMNIFNSIEAVTKNKIVFIDELDANINGVYLKALLKYLNDTKKGQLCFTTHNLYPMYYLYNFSNAIDFIGETGKVVSWIKNGNYRPYKLYPEGMIADSPFNIDPIDFMSVFEVKD